MLRERDGAVRAVGAEHLVEQRSSHHSSAASTSAKTAPAAPPPPRLDPGAGCSPASTNTMLALLREHSLRCARRDADSSTCAAPAEVEHDAVDSPEPSMIARTTRSAAGEEQVPCSS